MKRLLLAVLFGVASMSSISTKAQINISLNIGSQPAWGPTGYDHVDYYYLPDVDAYYYVPTQQYIYLVNGAWAWRNSLPARYSGYDLYNGYKVVMNTPKPYLNHQTHITQYSRYKNYKVKQSVIRDSRDAKYVNARNHISKPTQHQQVRANAGNNNRDRRNVNNGKNNQKDKGRGGRG
jgi:hypothetical protein